MRLHLHSQWLEWLSRVVLAAIVGLSIAPMAQAAGLSNRSDLMGNAGFSTVTTHRISFTTATAATISSVGFAFCDAATGACMTPTGLVTTSASIAAQSGVSGFVLVATTNGMPFATGAPTALGAGTPVSFTLASILNPSTPNQTFFVRITTYTGSDGATGPVDTGTVAVSTVQPVQLQGVTPEILIFCVGTSITSNCSTISGSSINFGDFDPLATRSGTSVMQAQTNAANGYVITVNGTTLASGVNTIPALTSQTPAITGIGQFGLNLRANTIPPVGAEPTGVGGSLGTVMGTYNTPNAYRFNTGDSVASAPAPTNANTYTSSYIVDIGGNQAAGVYTATMTYICTASF